MKRATLAVFAALIWAAASLGIQQTLAQEPGSSARLDQLGDFTGDGTCTGHVLAAGSKPGHDTTGKYHGEKILDGNWIVMHYDEDRTASNSRPYHVVQYLGYDAANKRFTSVVLDNSGVGYSTGTSSGWKGDTFSVDNTAGMGGKRVTFRDVFTKSGSGMSGHTGMAQNRNGNWVKTDEETCRKTS